MSKTVFFTAWFDIQVSSDYRTVTVKMKDGYELKVDPSQSSTRKIVVMSIGKETNK